MEEIELLQQQLQLAQLADSAHRISERNCVEIILKLIETQRIKLIFTKSGKEYLTQKQVKNEIEDEIVAHNGRITIVELGPLLNIDTNYVEESVKELLHTNKKIVNIDGQLITDYYLDSVVEEINETLQDVGQIALVTLAQRFTLPVQIIRSACESRIGTILYGYLKGDQLYTESFMNRHNARIRGIISAITRPTSLRTLVNSYGLLEDLVYNEINHLINTGLAAGTLKGSADRAVYTPYLYTRAQSMSVDTFYIQNGYVEYSKLERLSISNPKAYLKSTFPDGLALDTIYISETIVNTVIDSVEEIVEKQSMINITPLLPSIVSNKDIQLLASHVLKQINTNHSKTASISISILLLGDNWIVSAVFVNDLINTLTPSLQDLAVQTLQASQVAQAARKNAALNNEEMSDDEDDSRKKSKIKRQVVDSDEEEDSGKRGKKGKKSKSKRVESDDDSEEELAQKKKSKGKKKTEPSTPTNKSTAKTAATEALSRASLTRLINQVLSKRKDASEIEEEFIKLLATHLLTPCMKIYTDAVRTHSMSPAIVGDATWKRQVHESVTAALQDAYDHVIIFQNAITSLSDDTDPSVASGKSNKSTPTTISFLTSIKKQLIEQLDTHLLKTLCSSIVDLFLRAEVTHRLTPAQQAELTIEPVASKEETNEQKDGKAKDKEKPTISLNRSPFQARDREAILKAFPKSLTHFRSLVDSLSSTSSTFLTSFEHASKSSDYYLKRLDKKKERNVLFNMRRALQLQLQTEQKAALVYQYTVLILYSKINGVLFHAPPRSIVHIAHLMQSQLSSQQYLTLRIYGALLRRAALLSSGQEETSKDEVYDEDEQVESQLEQIGKYNEEEVDKALDDGLAEIRVLGETEKKTKE